MDNEKKKNKIGIIIGIVFIFILIGVCVIIFSGGKGLNLGTKKVQLKTSYKIIKNSSLSKIEGGYIQTNNNDKTVTIELKNLIVPLSSLGDINQDGYITEEDANLILKYNPVITSLGDMNDDNNITTDDARILQRIASGIDVPTDIQKILGDINQDGKITTDDARLLLRQTSGLEDLDLNVSFKYGDINLDGNLSQEDVELILKYSASVVVISELQKKLADINQDGKITTDDGRIVARIIEGYEKDSYNINNADVNNDGKVNSDDARLVLREVTMQYCKNPSENTKCSYSSTNTFKVGVGTHYFSSKNLEGAEILFKIIVSSDDSNGPKISSTKVTCNPNKTIATIHITASDNKGLAAKAYSKNGIRYTSNKTLSYTSNGTTSVYVKDRNNNVTKKSVEISCLDKTAPTYDHFMISESSPSLVRIDITNAKDDVKLAPKPYSIDNKTFQSSFRFEITTNGTYYGYIKDAAGNVTKTKNYITVDTIKNTVSSTNDTEKPLISNVTASCNADKSLASIKITAKDRVGLADKAYSIDGKNYFSSNTLTYENNGVVIVYVKDKSNNVSTKNISITCLDKTAPTYTGYSVTYDKSNAKIIILGMKDNFKTKTNPYYFNGKWQSSNSFVVTKNDTYNINIADNAGNSTTVKVLIDGIK